jgi:hypothetical protein
MSQELPVPSDQHNPDLPMDGDDTMTLTKKASTSAQKQSTQMSTEIKYVGTYMSFPMPFVR